MLKFEAADGSIFVKTDEPSNPLRCFGCCTTSQKHRANRSPNVFSSESPIVKRLGTDLKCRVCGRKLT